MKNRSRMMRKPNPIERMIAINEFHVKYYDYMEHPDFPYRAWQEVVASGHTEQGYWEWAYDLDQRMAARGIAE